MHTRRSSSALAVSGEVSLSFQDELAATIHRAFEVAVEIAVVEVSKLVSQALRDVRDQMQETIRENTILKTRLQSTEHELDTVRKAKRGKSSASAQDEHKTPQTKSQSKTTSTEKTKPSAEETGEKSKYENGSEKPDKSFCEIREDGSVQSRDLGSALTTSQCHDAKSGLSHHSLLSDKQQKTQNYQDIQPDQNQSSILLNEHQICKTEECPETRLGKSSKENDSEEENNQIKAGCSFNSELGEAFEPDRLSLVQSKLLEDWRPDPDTPQNHKNECVETNSNQILDTPDMILPVSDRSDLSAPFDGLFHSITRTRLIEPALQNDDVNVRTNVPTRIHQCKICGHSFSRASDLRRHHSHRHRVRASNTGKATNAGRPIKQQLFPPGCSPYHCNECGRDFNRMENLKTHLRIHTGERPYSCTVCGVRFRHSGALTRHFRIHTGEKPYVCGQCGKRFRNCGGLRFHQKSHTRDRHMVMNCT